MVYIKTRMRGIPEACCKCSHYIKNDLIAYDIPACGAIGADDGIGKIIIGCKTDSERPKWCPLVER